MLSLILASAVFAPQGPGTSTAPVVINEFVYDDSGTDDFEFVELFNRSPNPVDISLWKVVCNDDTSPPLGAGTVPTHTIPAGTILAPGAFYLLGNLAIVPTAIPGFSQVLPVNGLENGSPDTVELQNVAGTVIDEITYEMGGFAPFTLGAYTYPGEGGFNGDLSVGNGPAGSAARYLDGYDNNNNNLDFALTAKPSPGTSNVLSPALPYVDTFDTGAIGTTVPGWTGGWVPPRYVDPTVLDSQNPSVKPASPAGLLAMSTWDNSGGGNTITLDTTPMNDVVVETFVYLEPIMTPFNAPITPYTAANNPMIPGTYNGADGEAWAVGVRGTMTPNARPADLGGYWAATALGTSGYHSISGLCWAHVRTPTFSRLYLLDCHDGPTQNSPQNHTVLAAIDIVLGVNDGWQRIRLHAQGEDVIANFGGTYGFDNGQRFSAKTTTTGLGQVYVGYREALLYNLNGAAGCHPPLFDLFDVHVPTTSKTYIGTPSATTVGTPSIDTNGLAIVGTTGFAITGSSLVPSGHPGYTFCGLALAFSAVPGGFPLPGAPATAIGYVLPLASILGFANASGNVSFTLTLPPSVAYLGVSLVGQLGDYDSTMPNALPVGTSRGMISVIGH